MVGRAFESLHSDFMIDGATFAYGSDPTALGLVGVLRNMESEEVNRVPECGRYKITCSEQQLS